MRIAWKRPDESLGIDIGGRFVAVRVKRSARARRLTLRVDAAAGSPVMTVPERMGLARAERFLKDQAGWLEARLSRLGASLPFGDGMSFPLRGEPCRIEHRGGRGLAKLETGGGGQVLSIAGDPAHLPRRVADWLKREARRDLEEAVLRHTATLGRQHSGIRIGDPKSRWGSCTSRGGLAFSWRLILAPSHVLDYLAAHEVAHLEEMNHGRGFWALVKTLDPDFDKARAWLKRNGASLHAIGRDL